MCIQSVLGVQINISYLLWLLADRILMFLRTFLETMIITRYMVTMMQRLIATLFNVSELIMSNYVAVSINNWLQEVSAMKAFVSCVQNLANHKPTHNCVKYLVTYAPTLKHTTPLVSVCYITCLTLQCFSFCMHLTKAFMDEMSCNQLLIDTAA